MVTHPGDIPSSHASSLVLKRVSGSPSPILAAISPTRRSKWCRLPGGARGAPQPAATSLGGGDGGSAGKAKDVCGGSAGGGASGAVGGSSIEAAARNSAASDVAVCGAMGKDRDIGSSG